MLSSKDLQGGGLFALSLFLILLIGIIGVLPAKDINISLGKQLLAEWALMAFFAIFFIRNIWVRLFFLWCLFITIHNYNKFSFLTLHTVFIYLMFYQVAIDKIKRDAVEKVLNGICIVTLCQIFWMGLQFFKVDPLFKPTGWGLKNPLVGFLMNGDISGAFLAISLPAFFRKKWIWFIPVVFIALIMTRAFSAILPAMIGIIFFSWFKIKNKRKFIAITFSLFGSMIFYIFKFESGWQIFRYGSGRIPLWINTIKEFICLKPIVGWGLGQYQIAFPIINKIALKQGTNFTHSHNELLNIIAEVGLIGLIFVMGYFISLFIKFLKNKTELGIILITMVVISLLNANANFLMHTIVGIEVIIVLALTEKEAVCLSGI